MAHGKVDVVQYVCTRSLKFVFDSEALKSILEKKLVREQIMIPPDSVLLGHEYLKHGGSECGKNCLHYHVYSIPKDVELLHALVLAYKTGICIVTDS